LHIVTKFLVVLAAVLAILLAGLSIAYTSNADRIVGDLSVERDRAAKAEGQAAAVTAAAAGEREALQAKIAELENALAQANASMSDLQGQNARLLAETNSLKQASVTHSAQIDQFTAVVQTYAALNKSQAEELAGLRDRELDSARKEIELTDRINDLSSELEVARETTRALQEQLAETRQQMDSAAQPASSLSSAASPGEAGALRAPTGFRSQITDVRQDTSGQVLASIPAGASDGLRERMRLSIVRDGFLAVMILERVDQNEAVGRVDFLGRKGQVDVRAGDLVMASAL
jgi:predicted  nucleic acid-binding Zn-ribbon protein